MATRRDAAPAAATPGQRIYFVSLGCPKNQVDTELMLGQVQAAGHSLVDAPEGADVIVVNTCAFIDAAKEESVDTILEMAQHKQSGAQKLVVTGCLAQRYADELARDIPATLEARPDLRAAMRRLLDEHELPVKVTEGGDRCAQTSPVTWGGYPGGFGLTGAGPQIRLPGLDGDSS